MSAQPYVGKPLSHRQFTIDAPVLDDYFAGLELAPTERVPTAIVGDPDNVYFGEIAFDNHIGHLWMRQGLEFLAPLQAGATYDVGGEIVDIYDKRDRSVVCYQVQLTDAAGNVAVRTQHHQSFLQQRPDSGEVEFRAPQAKPGARRFDVPDGKRFGGLTRTITVAMCGAFFHGDANYHTDADASKELGFRNVVVGGRMTQAYACHILEQQFGAAWWQSGKLDIKFTNPVWTDDEVTAHGVLTGADPDAPERQRAFVWLQKADATIVLVAEASAAA